MPKRCGWVKMNNPLYVAYHDEEWGQPLHDDQALFELLCLETYQAGLSWETVLNKRQAFREAFHGYHLQGVAEMSDEKLEALLDNPAIIRNRAKIFATRANAQAFLQVQAEFGSFDAYLWSFVAGKTIVNDVPDYSQERWVSSRMMFTPDSRVAWKKVRKANPRPPAAPAPACEGFVSGKLFLASAA